MHPRVKVPGRSVECVRVAGGRCGGHGPSNGEEPSGGVSRARPVGRSELGAGAAAGGRGGGAGGGAEAAEPRDPLARSRPLHSELRPPPACSQLGAETSSGPALGEERAIQRRTTPCGGPRQAPRAQDLPWTRPQLRNRDFSRPPSSGVQSPAGSLPSGRGERGLRRLEVSGSGPAASASAPSGPGRRSVGPPKQGALARVASPSPRLRMKSPVPLPERPAR